eukprot:gb/GECG01004773.1/.p1 GENE.gb/GECG01004773.1/~~gb/GECG01004773.1/.p1  ORF type:complete len:235 (+),score=21.48 gb/GECG01004773.1/:1-705(+)
MPPTKRRAKKLKAGTWNAANYRTRLPKRLSEECFSEETTRYGSDDSMTVFGHPNAAGRDEMNAPASTVTSTSSRHMDDHDVIFEGSRYIDHEELAKNIKEIYAGSAYLIGGHDLSFHDGMLLHQHVILRHNKFMGFGDQIHGFVEEIDDEHLRGWVEKKWILHRANLATMHVYPETRLLSTPVLNGSKLWNTPKEDTPLPTKPSEFLFSPFGHGLWSTYCVGSVVPFQCWSLLG